ncbi:putative AT hook domain-containing protein [Rosellinia necatrix]|uniref:Putative AT hook domain-containing protein n=1 Tax=Rosellinia necatrix TaxID=77044 RepID=A0A1S7UM19_ROSNE|nr:putative AT hook domain-containing protein [Rosellinia necatrix]
MATSREERMQQRMRGAGRHEVADDSFGFVLPVAETSPDPSPSLPQPRSEPNTSAKRRRLNDEPGPVNPQPSSASTATRSSTRLSGGQEPTPTNPIAPRLNSPPTTATRISARLSTLNLNQDGTPRNSAIEDAPRDLPAAEIAAGEPQGGSDGPRQPTPRPNSRASEASEAPSIFIQSMIDLLEEVTESPVTAPGSGRRRRIEPTEALTQSAKLQRMVMAEEEAGFGSDLATSSPLARKTRQSMATVGTLSTRTTRASVRKTPSSPIEALHGSSPLARHSRRSNSTMLSGSARSMRSQERRSSPGTVAFDAGALSSPPDAVGTSSPIKPQLGRKKPETIPESPYEIEESEDDNQQAQAQAQVQVEVEVEAEADHEKAQEVDDHEAAQRIGQKRRRVSPRQRRSPDAVDDADPPTLAIERPARKRQARHKISPAKQSQPKPIKRKKKPPARRKSDGDSIPVTVQRYTKPLRRNDSDADEDILNADIPFTDHKSPNVIDVVLQMCEESLDKYLSTLHEEASQADGSANRKIYRIKLRTVEAFQEELRTQLQAQTIALDNLRTLKKRVKAAQKEKISLRNEILRIRAEREQVSLKIDAVRMRHETANKDSLNQLGLSSTMDDVELAIENGKMAPELNSKERKMAELANLDLLISQITNQVSAVGEAGGALKQIKDFNMFLERAAIALEGR